jgi:hypothetical protein
MISWHIREHHSISLSLDRYQNMCPNRTSRGPPPCAPRSQTTASSSQDTTCARHWIMEVLYYVYMKTHTYHRLVTYGNCLAMCLIIVYVCSDYGNYVYIYIPMHTHIYIDIMYTYIYIYVYEYACHWLLFVMCDKWYIDIYAYSIHMIPWPVDRRLQIWGICRYQN